MRWETPTEYGGLGYISFPPVETEGYVQAVPMGQVAQKKLL